MNPPTSFTGYCSLPTELVLHVVGYLDETSDLFALLRTNRHHLDLLTPLLHQHAIREKNGTNALVLATCRGQTSLVRLLLGKGFDPKQRIPPTDLSALHIATRQGNLEIVKLLLDNGAEVDARYPTCGEGPGRTPLAATILHLTGLTTCNLETVRDFIRELLQRGADPRAEVVPGLEVMYFARRLGNKGGEIVQMLVEYGVVEGGLL